MSLLLSLDNCSLISHEQFVNNVYKKTHLSNDGAQVDYKIKSDLFELNVPYRRQLNNDDERMKKRRRKTLNKKQQLIAEEHRDEYELIQRIKSRTETFINKCRERQILSPPEENETNDRLKQCLDEWQSIDTSYSNQFSGRNEAANPAVMHFNGITHIIPPKCTFSNADVTQLQDVPLADGYDIVVMDPPWWNKYVRRTRIFNRDNGYQMLSNDQIAKIPIERAIQAHRTLVAIWCTNAPSMIQAVKESFFPKWQLKLVATWFWIKITKSGEPICEFDLPLKKQPFERIFIACHKDSSFNIPDEKLIFSVPSSIHSHKPPLQDLLRPYCNKSTEDTHGLEIFARYLLPNCMSIGLEVLKLQNLQLFHYESTEKIT